MRQIYLDPDANNAIKKIQFLTPAEGFVSFEKWIGYTQDSGRTFVKKYITTSNVNYNNQYVNLTFGFGINGVYAFDKNNLLVYGDYGFVPAVLSSSDGGATFLLVYLATFNPNLLSRGIADVYFSGTTGFAIAEDKILKTTNRGQSWGQVYSTAVPGLLNLNFFDAAHGLAIGQDRLLKTTDGGATWQAMNKPAGTLGAGSFISEQTGWVNTAGHVYKTADGGASWALKNDDDNLAGYASFRFLNDSVGYAAGDSYYVAKTTDGGKYWEVAQRDNNYSYLGYGHNHLFFFNPNIAWAGGGHGFLELTANGGGNTVPKAVFAVDYSQLPATNTINLVNKTKPGYSYQWFKNRALFATTYNASYVSNRLGIDTVQLVVTKGALSDTAVQLVETRANPGYTCKADFTLSVDTASVQVTATDSTSMSKHVWYFGDGAVDSSGARVRHSYASVGTYTIRHVVSSTVYHCADSTTQSVTIIRTQNCLIPDFTYTADSFYTNVLTFRPTFSATNESGAAAMSVLNWQWGDGKPDGTQNSHQYDAPGYYTACLTVKNFFTGCISNVCKPVLVSMDSTCNAAFLVQTSTLNSPVNFTGKPNSRKATTKNTWIISGRSPVNTGTNDAFQANFYTQRYGEGPYFDLAGNSCGYPYTFEISIDSIRRTVTRIVRDTVRGCTDSLKQAFGVPRLKNVYIQATVNPSFSQSYSFYAYELDSKGDTVPNSYSSRWRLSGPGGSYYAGGYNGGSNRLNYTFSVPGTYTAAVAANTCSAYSSGREVYYITFNVTADSCPIAPPDFYTQADTTVDNTLQFLDPTLNQNMSLNNSWKWYFGDGDSSTGLFPKHTYAAPGIYNATLQYTNPNGCSKKVTKAVTVTSRSCRLVAKFSTSGSTKAPATIQFINKTTPDTATVSYVWHFGTLDSSTLKNPVYTFANAGAYVVRLTAYNGPGCQQTFDSLLVIQPADSCKVKAGMIVPATVQAPATVSFQNTSTGATAYAWNFGDGTTSSQTAPGHVYTTPGSYNVKLIASNGTCADTLQKTITVTNKPDTCTLRPQFIFVVDSVSPFTVHFIPAFSWRNGLKGLWNFGDGSTSTAVSPVHDFGKEGNYKVCLQVKDSVCERTVCDTVVLAKPLREPLIVYPNPAGKVLTVSYTLVIREEVSILLYSDAGLLVKQYRKASRPGTNTLQIDISGLKTGFYYVMVNTVNNFNNAVGFFKL